MLHRNAYTDNQYGENRTEYYESAAGERTIGQRHSEVFGFVTPQAIYKWQHGTALPTIDNLVVLAAILQVRIDDILVTDEDIAAGIGNA